MVCNAWTAYTALKHTRTRKLEAIILSYLEFIRRKLDCVPAKRAKKKSKWQHDHGYILLFACRFLSHMLRIRWASRNPGFLFKSQTGSCTSMSHSTLGYNITLAGPFRSTIKSPRQQNRHINAQQRCSIFFPDLLCQIIRNWNVSQIFRHILWRTSSGE